LTQTYSITTVFTDTNSLVRSFDWFPYLDTWATHCSSWIHFCMHFWSWNPQNIWLWSTCKTFPRTRWCI